MSTSRRHRLQGTGFGQPQHHQGPRPGPEARAGAGARVDGGGWGGPGSTCPSHAPWQSWPPTAGRPHHPTTSHHPTTTRHPTASHHGSLAPTPVSHPPLSHPSLSHPSLLLTLTGSVIPASPSQALSHPSPSLTPTPASHPHRQRHRHRLAPEASAALRDQPVVQVRQLPRQRADQAQEAAGAKMQLGRN